MKSNALKKLDTFWKSNREWWEYKDHIKVIKANAPPEAQKSYKTYLEQTQKHSDTVKDI